MEHSSSGDVQLKGMAMAPNNLIVGRSDDWPLLRQGETRPYFDYLLVVFSGDDRDALAKRENMREVQRTNQVHLYVEQTYSSILSPAVSKGFLIAHYPFFWCLDNLTRRYVMAPSLLLYTVLFVE